MCHDVLKPRKHALQDLSLDLFVLADAPAHLSQLKPALRARWKMDRARLLPRVDEHARLLPDVSDA